MHMSTSRLLTACAGAALAVLLAPRPGHAQPGAPPPPPPHGGGGGYYGGGYYVPPPPERDGFTIGFGIGLGGMNSDSNLTECFDCDVDPIAAGIDFHIGGMINPRMALLFEFWGHAQQIDEAGVNVLSQSLAMGAIQYWTSPRLWLKGGLGFASLDVSYDDGYIYDEAEIDSGLAILGAIGYELVHSHSFALDLQLRLASAGYEGIDETVNVGMIGIGFNWY